MILCGIHWYIKDTDKAVSYTHLDVYKRQLEDLGLKVTVQKEYSDTDDNGYALVDPGYVYLSLIHIFTYSRYKTTFLFWKELIFGKGIADRNVAVLAFLLNLQQDLKNQFSCIYSAVNHDLYLLQG